MDHQDWNQVVFNKQANSKSSFELTNEITKIQKLDNETDILNHDRVSLSLGKQIQQARINSGYKTQKDLAFAISEKPDVIISYENGKAIPDNSILQKLRKVLKCKFK
jgi:putative transcription factor